MSAVSRTLSVLTILFVTLPLQASCARSEGSDGEADPLLASPDAKNPVPLTVCIATDCPAPWASCGDGLCTTDTRTDINHCGACGIACPKPPRSLHFTSLCVDGKCSFVCDELSADCNGKPSDGCEVFTGDDPNNCGACGKQCKTGEICWKGACGCPSGFTACDGECKNLAADDKNCTACGKTCEPPPGADPAWVCGPNVQPVSTDWGCTGGGCKIVCKAHFGDCDRDLCATGCEVDTRIDPVNCGSCGNVCPPNQECVDGTCICPEGTTRCGKRCVDLAVDVDNCGACGNYCPGASDESANGSPTCSGGVCGYVCYKGFADCDKSLGNGCEVNLANDPRNCGGCGTKCDAARGQPCVAGQCLTKPCDPSSVTK